jgi:RNA ligase (TIGR02306 family)
MSENLRKLVTVRTVNALDPIDGADAIEVATVEGWKVVVKKNEFKVGDPVVYFEIDSFLPTGNPAWQFLVDKSSREFEGSVGHRLRTVRLRGQVSQGFVIPLAAVPQIVDASRDIDQSELLGIKKWEAPLSPELAGQAQGLFPSFIRKTDQERCQNLINEIFQYDEQRALIDGLSPEQADEAVIRDGRIIVEDGKVFSIRPPKANRNTQYEITMKMDGSSATFFHRNGEVGACSRNLQLKVNAENASNSFVKMLVESGLQAALPQLGNIAIQGELMGPGIQGNRENLKGFVFFVFEVQHLDESRNAHQLERYTVMDKLYNLGVDRKMVRHAPIFADGKFSDFDTMNSFGRNCYTLQSLDLTSTEALLKFAEGPSITNPVREGLVFKSIDGSFSFKTINNVFLTKEKD